MKSASAVRVSAAKVKHAKDARVSVARVKPAKVASVRGAVKVRPASANAASDVNGKNVAKPTRAD